jgi:hypothetical protein
MAQVCTGALSLTLVAAHTVVIINPLIQHECLNQLNHNIICNAYSIFMTLTVNNTIVSAYYQPPSNHQYKIFYKVVLNLYSVDGAIRYKIKKFQTFALTSGN